MAKQLSYADALKLLGKNDSEVLAVAEKLADGGLGALGVPDLFGIRGMVVGKGRKALEGMRDKLRGESRMSRTEKILAAERILVVVSFFEAVEEAWEQAGMPFPFRDLEITAEEQTAFSERALSGPSAPIVLRTSPEPEAGAEADYSGYRSLKDLIRFEALQDDFLSMVVGLAVSEAHGITDVHHGRILLLKRRLAGAAELRYREHRRALMADVPEFAMWAQEREHTRTRDRLDTGLAEMGRLLGSIASDRPVERRRAELSALYRSVLHRPVLPADDGPAEGLVLPTLGDAYIPPRGRVAMNGADAVPSSEKWWADIEATDDIAGFVSARLVHPRGAEAPTVILGHPGSGKSKFTEMLAAQLPPSDFLPIRVELRSVPPDASIPRQIEEGLAAALHTRVSWRELADSADGALPVIMLDGFDELLQATGVDRSDYLEQVQEFQRQQEAMGLPVAVIVTSRTVVADRARFPKGTAIVKLEPFDEARIDRFLQVWKAANARPGADPEALSTAVVLRYRDLAEQPLLLAMLLLYDAEDGALRRADRHLTHGELYERLLTAFARREVRKHRSALDRDGFDRAVEEELRRLEVTALAMFARRRQHVTAGELNRDLGVLMPGTGRQAADADPHGRIDPAHRVLGRFFFVHEARARTVDGTASVFEFLHATFGEYLVARAVVAALDYLAETRSLARRRRGSVQGSDDGELYALLSFACLPGREKITDFLDEELEKRFPRGTEARSDRARLLIELFQEAPFPAADRSRGDYEPTRLPITIRQANYTANLIVLLVLAREDPVGLEELFPEAPNPLAEWRNAANLWRTLQSSEWFSLLRTVRVKHLDAWDRDRRHTVVVREHGEPVNVGECIGFELYTDVDATPDVLDPYQVTLPYASTTSRMLRATSMRVNGTNARTVLGTLPYLHRVSYDLGGWFLDPGRQRTWTEMHEVLRLRLEPPETDFGARISSYRRLLSGNHLGRVELLALRQAAEDANWAFDDLRWNPAGGRPSSQGREELRRTVADYLTGLEHFEQEPGSSQGQVTDSVRSVLGRFPPGYLPNGIMNRFHDLTDISPVPDGGHQGYSHPPIVISPPGSGEH
ncbi:hypothetical protein ABZ249_01050 [Nocardiopsis sp. NPDC006139]|uniref:NACHT domain-containing protein n=1 Tax=Nocardiopsis sp. NPDC006139 TaxID=3154578 RepID=UPI00339F91F0